MSEKKQPEKKVKCNKISVSLWHQKRLVPGKKDETGYVEQWVESQRACIQHSRKQNGEWVNQQIWLNVDELRDVSQALDEIGEEDSSPSSFRVNNIMGYIKSNSLDAGLDVYDVDEMSVAEVLEKHSIYVELSPNEEQMVRNELREYVERKEFSESAYMVQKYNPLALIPERGARVERTGEKFASRSDFISWTERLRKAGLNRHVSI